MTKVWALRMWNGDVVRLDISPDENIHYASGWAETLLSMTVEVETRYDKKYREYDYYTRETGYYVAALERVDESEVKL